MTCPPTDQNKKCPNTSAFSNVRTYIGQDGCQYPCPSSDSINQDNIPESCLAESSSQSAARFSVNEENSIKPQQQTTEPSQQNVQTTSSQNAFVNPGINSDTSSGVFNSELTTTQKSFNPAGKLRSGLGQTESSIPGKSNGLSRPLTPGSGNAQVEGIPIEPNTNPQTPIDPGNIPTSIPDKAYLTVITKMIGFYTGYLKVSDFEICVKSTIQTDGNSRDVDAIPRCANGSASGVQYTVQAPGSITIWVNNLDELGVQSVMIETPNLNNYISAYESKTSPILYFTVSATVNILSIRLTFVSSVNIMAIVSHIF